MAIQKTEAIILKTQPFRSTSLIVTFFTKEFGKVLTLGKGVRDERQSRGAIYELFTQLEIIYYEKTRSDLHLLSEAFVIDTYETLRTKLESIVYASYFVELVDKLTELHDPHGKIFELLDFSFRYLPSIPGKRLARLFEIKLLNEIGWLPLLDSCLSCEKAHLDEGYFSARQGAFFCSRCAHQHPDAIPLAAEPLLVMKYYIRHSLEQSVRLGMAKQTEEDLEALLSRFLIDRMNRPLKSRAFLDSIKPALA